MWPSFTSLAYAVSYARAYPDRCVAMVPVSAQGSIAAAFHVYADVAESILPTVPWATTDRSVSNSLCVDLKWLRQQLCVSSLWFPLMCEDMAATRLLMSMDDVMTFSRRPSPIIDWSNSGSEVWTIACERLGGQAERRRKAFEKIGLSIQSIEDPERAVQFIAQVERMSWKASSAQDMFSRDQFALYSTLIRERVLRTVGVVDDGRPVAYRLDGRADHTLFCVKWSYVEGYSKVSPGFYLIAQDLARRYGQMHLARMDLYGGLDTLKAAVMTGARSRVDVVWPGGPAAVELTRRGLAFDSILDSHFRTGRGLRYLYGS
jgi:hypothetical protein